MLRNPETHRDRVKDRDCKKKETGREKYEEAEEQTDTGRGFLVDTEIHGDRQRQQEISGDNQTENKIREKDREGRQRDRA